MSSQSAWQQFFDGHAERYEENPFTKHTAQEVDFFLELFSLEPGSTVLDMGCGTGRHAIELAKRGFEVVGVDLSAKMLEVARRNALRAGVNLELVQADAQSAVLGRKFDAAICLCEGGIGLIERGEDAEQHDGAIFATIARHLGPGAPFLLTALNGYSIIRQMKDEHTIEGRFDPGTMMASYQDEWDLPEGTKLMTITERLFIAPELARILRQSGFEVQHVYGGTAGHWGRRPLSLDEVEAMFVCRRSAEHFPERSGV